MRLLESAGRESGVGLILLTDKTKIAEVADYVVQGNTAQMRDAAFMAELKSWLRFSETDAVATRDGLFARASGNPTMPSWLARADSAAGVHRGRREQEISRSHRELGGDRRIRVGCE